MLNKHVSPVIVPQRSILAGCLRSMQFARLIMRTPVSSVVRRVPSATTSTFVDDVAQTARGTFQAVANTLVHAGTLFFANIRSVHLSLSAKSVVVASQPRLARLIATYIAKHAGIQLRVQSTARDLGVENNPTGRRSTKLQQARIKKATARTVKISRLAKSVRRASVLSYTGALP